MRVCLSWVGLFALVALAVPASLAGCGGGGDGDKPDARTVYDAKVFDAAPKVYCIDKDDALCGHTPDELTPAELSLADQLTLAQVYNPSMVMSGPEVWPVKVGYALANTVAGVGGGLWRVEHDGRENFSFDVDMATAEAVIDTITTLPSDLTTLNMRTLPLTAPGGRGYVYYVDGIGENVDETLSGETWGDGWRTAQGYDTPGAGDPKTSNYPANQYVHLFWLNKAESLLAIQYWFYYPYDKFTNSHEGDWEHVNVILDYEAPSAPIVVGTQFSWHGRQSGFLADQLYYVGDHVVVFVGGETCTLYSPLTWCGGTSGASWPYPGTWNVGYAEEVDGYAGRPGRSIAHDVFTLTLLPRLADMDFGATPELSWYQFPFLAGEPITATNAPVVMSTRNDRGPVGPAPDHGEFDVGMEGQFDILRDGVPKEFDPPAGWTLSNSPPSTVFP